MKKHFVIFLLAVSANFASAGNLIDVIMKEGTLKEFKRHTPPRRTAEITFELPYGKKLKKLECMEYSSYIDAQRKGKDFYAVVSRHYKGKPKIEYFTIAQYQKLYKYKLNL